MPTVTAAPADERGHADLTAEIAYREQHGHDPQQPVPRQPAQPGRDSGAPPFSGRPAAGRMSDGQAA
jgi:hypothetical protein